VNLWIKFLKESEEVEVLLNGSEIISVEFNGSGNGIFGHSTFGSGFFGGASNSAPFRTFVPRQCQRCRYINIGFNHSIAREQFGIYGVTITGEVGLSTISFSKVV
jgi:hypothetical protein